MPQLQEGSIMWRVTGIPSTSLDESIKTSNTIAEAFKKFPEVETTLAMIGRAEKGETADVNYMEIYTALKPEDEWTSGRNIKQLEEAMQETLEEVVPNVVPGYTQPIQMRVEELISGVRATLALKLYGEDLERARSDQRAAQDRAGRGAGVADLSLEANIGKPQIRIAVNREELARHGMNAEEVLTIVRNRIWAVNRSACCSMASSASTSRCASTSARARSKRYAASRCATATARWCRCQVAESAWPRATPLFAASNCSATR